MGQVKHYAIRGGLPGWKRLRILALLETQELKLSNVEFRQADARNTMGEPVYGLACSRFMQTHLPDSEATLASFLGQLRPGGILALEDIDFSGSFAWPEPPTFRRFYDLYCAVVQKRGGDPYIGQRLPVLVKDAVWNRFMFPSSSPPDSRARSNCSTA